MLMVVDMVDRHYRAV